jgi:hypothetical protein
MSRAKARAKESPGRKVYLWIAQCKGKPDVFGITVDDAYPIFDKDYTPRRVGYYMGAQYYPEK